MWEGLPGSDRKPYCWGLSPTICFDEAIENLVVSIDPIKII